MLNSAVQLRLPRKGVFLIDFVAETQVESFVAVLSVQIDVVFFGNFIVVFAFHVIS